MRSRTPLPQRQQAHWGAFLEAAALFLALCVLGRSAALTLAAVVAAPFPAVQTALWWGQRNLQSETSDPEPEPAAEEQAPPASSAVPEAVQALTGGIEDYLVALQPEDARPADAGAVIEKQYPQGSGEKYIACGAGSIKNNTRQTAADLAAEIENPLPFAIEKDSPDPQVLVMHTHATEDYRLSAGLWFTPGDGARSTDRSINMCAVGRVVADTLNAAGIHTLHDETLNDYPSYTGSYANSRAVVQQYLAQYPSIKVVLDVHRDAIETENGSRMAPVCTVDGAAGRPGDDHLRVRQRHHRSAAGLAAEPAGCGGVGAGHGGHVPRLHPPGAVQLPVLQSGPDHRQPAHRDRRPRQQPERSPLRRAAGRKGAGRRTAGRCLTKGRQSAIF